MRGSIETRYNANNTARGILFTPFILSLSLSLFFVFSIRLHFCTSSFGRLNRAHRCREIRFCVLLKIIASLLLLLF
tara:strand:- start:219 stop:446 length:228 start_codon:yes stop_codon:yes gene_type:complete